MPAVELGRLQQQVAQLSDVFTRPESYVHGIEDLLRSHGVPVHRQGRVKGMRPILISYEVPPPLLRILTLEMVMRAQEHPMEALEIADGLWSRQTLETRQLAISLLGSITTESTSEITGRLESWAKENREHLLEADLSSNGTRTLRAKHLEAVLEMAGRLFLGENVRQRTMAIGALLNLVAEKEISNLPELFDLLAPVCKAPDKKIRPELAELLLALARSNPKEMEYFLAKISGDTATEDTRWLVRQASRALPEDGQARLRKIMR